MRVWVNSPLFVPFLESHMCRSITSLVVLGSNFVHLTFHSSSDHKAELSVLAALSLTMIFVLVQKRCSLTSKVAMAFGLLGIYCYRAAIGNVLFPWQPDNKDISK